MKETIGANGYLSTSRAELLISCAWLLAPFLASPSRVFMSFHQGMVWTTAWLHLAQVTMMTQTRTKSARRKEAFSPK